MIAFSLILALLPLSSIAAPLPTITTIQGPEARIEDPQGKQVPAKVGVPLKPTEKLVTNPDTSVLLTYPDGSRALIGKGSTFQVPEPEAGVTVSEVSRGSVRAVIRKRILPSGAKYHYLFRTRAAVMGVRGTDLVMSTDEGGAAEARIIEGLVDMAESESRLKEGAVKPLKTGQYLTSSDKGLSEPADFEVAPYVKALDERQMGLSTYKLDPAKPFGSTKEPFTSQETSFSRFRLGAIHVRQLTDGGYDYSAHLAYTPRLKISRFLALTLDASLFPLKLGEPRKWTLAYRVGGGLRFNLGPRFSIETGAGREQWGSFTQNGTSYFGNFSWNLRGRSLIRAIVFGLSYYDRPAKGSDPKNPSVAATTGLEFGF